MHELAAAVCHRARSKRAPLHCGPCVRSSMDRVLPSEGRGCWFDPSRAHHGLGNGSTVLSITHLARNLLPMAFSNRVAQSLACNDARLALKNDAFDLAQALQTALNQLSEKGKLREIFERHNLNWRGA